MGPAHFHRFEVREQNVRVRHESEPHLRELHCDAANREQSSELLEKHEAALDPGSRCKYLGPNVFGGPAAAL